MSRISFNRETTFEYVKRSIMHDAGAAFIIGVHVHADHAYQVYTADLFISHCGDSHACAGGSIDRD